MRPPSLVVNEPFMREIVSAEAPCFALGLVEVGGQQTGFLVLRPGEPIPREVTAFGFRFGQSLVGISGQAVVHFAFEFYGFRTYNALVNPNNLVVRTVLRTMVEQKDYFFFALDSNNTVTAFRSELGQDDLGGLKTNLRHILTATTTDAQYQRALKSFTRNPDPPGQVISWVCRDEMDHLDLTEHRLILNPSPLDH